MDLAKPGLIKEFCMPNGLFTFQEYLLDFASPDTKRKGQALLDNSQARSSGPRSGRRRARRLTRSRQASVTSTFRARMERS